MTKFILFLLTILGALNLTSCESSSSHQETIAFTNPIIKSNDFFSGSNWNDPHVMHDGNQFIMYASASKNFDGNVKIFRLISENGINWELSPTNAVLEKSVSGWDSHSVETPAVIQYEGKYHLFYTGYSGTFSETQFYKIGHATSMDGISWTKDATFLLESTDPSGVPNLDFNQFIVGEPGPVIFDGKIYLYFTAVGANTSVSTTWEVIGLTTYDGTTWSTPQSILEPDLTIYPRLSFYGYSTPNAIVKDGKVHLYYDVVADPWKQVKLHHAVSADGISGWLQDTSSLLNKEDFNWTQEEIRSPSALEYNEKLFMYFAGHTGTDLSIGLKTYP